MGKKKEASAPPEVQRTAQVQPEEYAKPPGVQVQGRSCRDVCFMLLFVLCWVGMVVIAAFAFLKGDVNRLKYGTDSLGNMCGVVNPAAGELPAFDATAMPLLHWLNPTSADPIKVCTATCPASGDMRCQYGYDWATASVSDKAAWMGTKCFPAIGNTEELFYRCIPTQALQMAASNIAQSDATAAKVASLVAQDMNAAETAAKISQALQSSWQLILGMSGVSVVISFVWLVLLNLFAGALVWLTVLLANISVGGMAAFLLYNWRQITTSGKLIMTGNAKVDSQLYNEQTLLILGAASAALFVVVFLISVAARARIKLAITLIKETSKAVRSMPMIVFFPIFKYVVMTVLFAFFVAVFAFLATSGNAIAAQASAQVTAQLAANGVNQTYIREVTPDRVLPFMQIYMAFGMFWSFAFVLGIWQCTIGGAVAAWYWCRDKANGLPRFPVGGALYRCFRYHLGSIAFGSMLIAIVQLIRLILFEAQRKLKAAGQDNKVAKYILSCLQCCFWCLEKFLKFINKNAYIEIAVYGYSFCEAARRAFDLLWRNAFRVVVVDKISNFVLFLGKLFIVFVTCLISLYLLQTQYASLGQYYAAPLVFIFVISWIVASFFTSVVDMAIDTLFLCFCEDCERNDGSSAKPYFMSPELQAFTDKYKGQQPDIAS